MYRPLSNVLSFLNVFLFELSNLIPSESVDQPIKMVLNVAYQTGSKPPFERLDEER